MPPPTRYRDRAVGLVGNRRFYADFSKLFFEPDRRGHAPALQLDVPNGAINYNLQVIRPNYLQKSIVPKIQTKICKNVCIFHMPMVYYMRIIATMLKNCKFWAFFTLLTNERGM